MGCGNGNLGLLRIIGATGSSELVDGVVALGILFFGRVLYNYEKFYRFLFV